MRILFTHSYFYQFDPKQWKNRTPYPPLGTIYAAAWLRSHGYEVALYDTALLPDHSTLEDKIKSFQPDALVVYDDGFNYLTKMCLTKMREAAFEMATMGKSLGLFTVACSSDSTDHYEKYLQNGFDVVMLGEGELTLLDLMETHQKKGGLSTVQGIAYGQGALTPKRPVLRELDTLPQPAWDLIDVEAYRAIWAQGRQGFTLNLATTRGCPFKCNWCAKPIYGNRYNSRSPERVVDEVEMHKLEHGVSTFWMCDDIFGLKPGWVQAFRDELNSRGLSIQYTIQSRVDLLLQDDTIEALVQSGLTEVWVGAESGSQKILDAMDKGTTVEQIYEATKRLKAHGVRVAFFLQFGYLGETKEDIDKTFKMLSDLKPDNIGVSVSYPLPGTPFYDRVKAQMGDKENWTDSDDLAMMFRNTFNPEYYRILHKYIHQLYRRNQGADHLKRPLSKGRASWKEKMRAMALYPYYVVQERKFRSKLAQLENVS